MLNNAEVLHPKFGNKKSRLPGDSGVWMFITMDMFGFLLLFTVFTIARIGDPVLFEKGRQVLHADMAFAMTLVLLTSSWFVVRAVESARKRIPAKVQSNLLAAMLLGLAFGVLKITGYMGDIAAGHSITTSEFFGYYFAMTGLHFLHVIVGMVVLAICFFKARSGPVDENYLVWIESGGCFWHMVDMIWVFLFPMIYLLRVI